MSETWRDEPWPLTFPYEFWEALDKPDQFVDPERRVHWLRNKKTGQWSTVDEASIADMPQGRVLKF